MSNMLRLGFALWMIRGVVCPGAGPGPGPGSSCESPVYSWPLGYGFANREKDNTVNELTLGQVTYGDGPLNYSAMEFQGNVDSYADLQVENTADLLDDYCLQMHIYLNNNTGGTLFSFRSNEWTSNPINILTVLGYTVYLDNGNVVVNVDHYGNTRFTTNLQPYIWYHFIFKRDLSNKKLKLQINRDTSVSQDLNVELSDDFAHKITDFPGTLRIGGSFDQESPPLDGRIACVQFVPGKDACVDHDAECVGWIFSTTRMTSPPSTSTTQTFSTPTSTSSSTTSTSSPTTSTSPTTTSTSSTPTTSTSQTTTSTSSTPTTSTSPLTTLTSATTTPTSTLTSSTSPLNILTSTTTTSFSPPTTLTSTSTTVSSPSTTTTSPSTMATSPSTTATSPSTTATSLPITINAPLSVFQYDIVDRCLHFSQTQSNAGFGSMSDILDSIVVDSVSKCSVHCAESPDCLLFTTKSVLSSFKCDIGYNTTNIVTEPGTTLYKIT